MDLISIENFSEEQVEFEEAILNAYKAKQIKVKR